MCDLFFSALGFLSYLLGRRLWGHRKRFAGIIPKRSRESDSSSVRGHGFAFYLSSSHVECRDFTR